MLKKTSLFILIVPFLISCSATKSDVNPQIDFNDVITDQSLSDSEKIIELKIGLSRQEDKITNLENNIRYFENVFDSLEKKQINNINYLKTQIDSFKIEQSILIGPEFSNNITKLRNKVNILEDRAFFMDSLYFSLVTDMVIIENQINSITNSLDEIDSSDDFVHDGDINNIDFNSEYKKALELYMSGEFNSSLENFQNLINIQISNDLVDNCQFWIGQIYFMKNNYELAIDEFMKVLKYDNSNKIEDSMYKMGLCYMKTNKSEKAIEIFNELIINYPKSKYFNKSNEFLLNLK